jgi:hypothetical protein
MYEALDLYCSGNGDLMISADGDLKDTSADDYRSLQQEISTRLKANQADWAVHPDLGANLDNLIGKMNTPETAQQVQAQIESALSSGLINSSHIQTNAVPLSLETLGLLLNVQVGPWQDTSKTVSVPIFFQLATGVYVS